MPTTIKCPNCRHEFAMEEAVSEQYKKDLREQMIGSPGKKKRNFRKRIWSYRKNCMTRKKIFRKN